MNKLDHDINFLRERAAARNVKRGLINSTRWERHNRRLRMLSCWQLTELGRVMLGEDNNDDLPGGDDGFNPPDNSPAPSGIYIGELAF